MRRIIVAIALVATACTPMQLHTVNEARVAHGQRPLDEVEAMQLYCAHWPMQRAAYLISIGLNPLDLGPAPSCGVDPISPKPPEPEPVLSSTPSGPYPDVIASVWPQHLWSFVSCIQFRESSNNPMAVGGAGERGLMQVHPNNFIKGGWGTPGVALMDGSGLTWDQMFDPWANHQAAKWIVDRAGGSFAGWSTAPYC